MVRWGLCVMVLGAASCAKPPCQPVGSGSLYPCVGGCACGGGCTCNALGQTVCAPAVNDAACRVTCLDDAGVGHYPGEKWSRADEACTCDYLGNSRCCSLDAGSCAVACVDGAGDFHQVGERWAASDGGTCNCLMGFVVDCGKAPEPVHCTFAGKGYSAGAFVDAGAGCGCQCGAAGHVTCPSSACLPSSCSYMNASYQPGTVVQNVGGCNSCVCGDDGAMACTSRVCSGGKCEYQGQIYDAGNTFASSDGCNTCTCQANGLESCTKMGCAAVHCVVDGGAVAVGTTFYSADLCNLCGCGSDGKVYCTQRACTP